ncbi:hypothetical protein [Streptomyces sp. NPDC056600]
MTRGEFLRLTVGLAAGVVFGARRWRATSTAWVNPRSEVWDG